MLRLMYSFIVHHAGMGTGPLLLLAFEKHSPLCESWSQLLPRTILAKALAACFGLGDATVFGPFRKNDDQSSLLIDNSVCPAVCTQQCGHIDASLHSRSYGDLSVSSHCSSAPRKVLTWRWLSGRSHPLGLRCLSALLQAVCQVWHLCPLQHRHRTTQWLQQSQKKIGNRAGKAV
jgi:hypothetical protein